MQLACASTSLCRPRGIDCLLVRTLGLTGRVRPLWRVTARLSRHAVRSPSRRPQVDLDGGRPLRRRTVFAKRAPVDLPTMRREPSVVARKLVTVGRDKVGWYVSLANSASQRQATHWNIVSCSGRAQALAYARVIRRAIADGIRESRARA